MIIKGITKKGDAIKYTAEEALPHAIKIAVANLLDSEFVYWIGTSSAPLTFSSSAKDDGEYEAFATGIVSIGKTRIADDKFLLPKNYNFKIHYRSSKDEIGAPHLEVADFSYEPTQMNASKGVGPADADNSSPFPTTGELIPTPVKQGGTISKKVSAQK